MLPRLDINLGIYEYIPMEFGFYIGAVILCIVCFALFRQYKQNQIAYDLLTNEHLTDIATKLIEMRTQEYDPKSPPVFMTDQGLIITYMSNSADDIDLYLHHFSLASTQINWHSTVQKSLISYICTLIDETPPEKVQISDRGVLHFTLVFKDKAQNEEYAKRVIEIPTVPKAYIDKRANMTIEKIAPATKEEDSVMPQEVKEVQTDPLVE
jgi:hypothetical protein